MYEAVSDLAGMPRITSFGITILEPFTVLTNLFIAFACFYAYYQLKKRKLNKSFTHRYMGYFFLLMGIATITGGVAGHAFLYVTGYYGKIPGWYISMAAIALFERAAIAHGRPLMHKAVGDVLSVANYIEIFTFMILSFYTLNFIFVELHAIYGLFAVVFIIECYIYIKTKDPALKHFFVATAFGLCAVCCHAFKLGINRWFNYNDVSHIAMLFAIFFYYKASLGLRIIKEEATDSFTQIHN